MEQDIFRKIASELNLKPSQVVSVLTLLNEGATVPFIARYRKEATGSLDEVGIGNIRDRHKQISELEERRAFILKTISEQGKLHPALEKEILSADSLSRLEDLYLPFRPRRRTRATIAKERGLEPLAEAIFKKSIPEPFQFAKQFVDAGKEVNTPEEAVAGAKDIIAEWISEDADARQRIRNLFMREGMIRSRVVRGKESEAAKFRDYFEWEEKLSRVPSHRLLAMRRGEKEGFLSLRIEPPQEHALELLDRMFIRGKGPSATLIAEAIEDGYKRLLQPGIETDVRLETREKADDEAIVVFAANLRELLMAAPAGQKRVMGIDPGFRTGCKIVCMDAQGKLLHHDAIFPHPPQHESAKAMARILSLIGKYEIEAIAIGNGTAGRETEQFIRSIELPKEVQVVMVNESGASVYSASEVAREEFPDKDVTVRGAVSIGRRLMDPLAELVKIDPKAIGVGQYQHDVDQHKLKKSLDNVVEYCVNRVGVELNTASKELLTYVSGLGPSLAGNIVKYREQNGPFRSREALKQVPRLGDKAFEQCAGFLRIHEGENPLDASAVHPERYALVASMAKDLGCSVKDLMQQAELRKKINPDAYVNAGLGLPTLKDILQELDKPGRDPRAQFEAFQFAEGVNALADLHEGMVLPGIVTNVTKFGAFVDVGVHQDGLVHVSELADRFVRDPAEVVKVQQRVTVKVLEVDVERKRVSFSMKGLGKN